MHRPTNVLEHTVDVQHFYTPLDIAVEELLRRKKDFKLQKAVRDFLNADIPNYFTHEHPIFYLARHIATPNYEALRFINMTKRYDYPRVIGQDSKGKFVGDNELKRSLGKLPIVTGIDKNNHEIIEHFTIIDFGSAQGKPLGEIYTANGENLIEFHNRMFIEICPKNIVLPDESVWIDRHFRDNLTMQYEHMFALCITNTIMFESYPPSETQLVIDHVKPAFDAIYEHFNVRPLIVEHISDQMELERNWNTYPGTICPYVRGQTVNGK